MTHDAGAGAPAVPGDPPPGLAAGLVNRALVAYVGRGLRHRPSRRPEALADLAPADRLDELRATVERLHAEADAIEVRADEAVGNSLVPAFAARVRLRHPWLDDAAVDALCWASRYRRAYE